VTTDPERLRIVLVNMLVNARHAVAAREGADGPLITISTRGRPDRATIVVADHGSGIDPADLARVFDPYFTTKRGGTGLGLAIAKNIIDGLGGSIGVTSTPGRGTEIRIELPVHA
jgi:signal transduction histidine kinase